MTNCISDNPRFLVLNKKTDWDAGLTVNLQTADAGITLMPTLRYATERASERTMLGENFVVTDFAVGQCNLLYILDARNRAVWVYDPNLQQFEQIERIASLFMQPTSLIFHPGTLYIADAQADQRLIALAAINWQIRWTIGPMQDASGRRIDLEYLFTPVDLATDEAGHVYALTPRDVDISGDAATVPAGGRLAIVKIDPGGRVVAVFKPPELQMTQATAVSALGDAIALVVARDNSIYVLEATGKQVLRFSADTTQVDIFSINKRQEDDTSGEFAIHPSSLGIDTERNLYVGDRRSVTPGQENEEDTRFIHIFSPDGKHLGEVSGYRGLVTKLAVDRSNRIYIFNDEERALIILNPEQTFLTTAALPTGYYFSPAFDSTLPGTRWHRLVIDADIPANTQIQISSLIADEREVLINGDRRNLDAYLADQSVRLEDKLDALDRLGWSRPLVNPADALIQGAPGRYLWLRVILIGNDQQTPTLRSVRAYFPRMSYLRYLPAVYQEDAQSRDFLERFLALFETFFGGLEGAIDQIARYFDVDVVGGAFLRWLASWLAIAADENWTDDQLRSLIQYAPRLYKQRGTREGIMTMIEIFTGDRPFIVEQFQLQCATSDMQPLLQKLYGSDPYCFCVLLKPAHAVNEDMRNMVRRIIEAEKPAHTCAGVLALQPWVYLDMHTYLEINTYLSRPSPRLDRGAAMPRDTVLGDIDEAGQIERRARLDIDTMLT